MIANSELQEIAVVHRAIALCLRYLQDSLPADKQGDFKLLVRDTVSKLDALEKKFGITNPIVSE